MILQVDAALANAALRLQSARAALTREDLEVAQRDVAEALAAVFRAMHRLAEVHPEVNLNA